MNAFRPIKRKARARAIAARLVLVAWTCIVMSIIVTPFTQFPSEIVTGVFLGKGKRFWVDLHFQLCHVAVALTIVHIVLDRRAILSCVRYLISANRNLLDLERQLDQGDV